MAVLYTNHFVQFLDNNGNPLSGGKLYAYEAGTTTPRATFTTEEGDVQNTNPVILDSSGRAVIFIDGSYRFDLFDSNDVLIKSTDDVTAFFPNTDAGQPGNTFSGKVFYPDSGELTILSGAVTPTGANHTVDTESDASTDDLDTINGGADGQVLTIRIEDSARNVVIKHNTGNILTPNGSDITLSSNEELLSLVYDSALSNWLVSSSNTSSLVQTVNVSDGAVATTTTQIPYDDTIPQISEGTEFMDLAITPTSASNRLKIEVVFNFSQTGQGSNLVVALFQDSTVDALAAAAGTSPAAGEPNQVIFTHWMTAGTTSATTFRVRSGPTAAETLTFNGAVGAGRLGGVMASSITITEYAA